MQTYKDYSIIRLFTIFISLLFLATVLLSVFILISFAKITYNNSLDYIVSNTEKNSINLSGELMLAQQQLEWTASNIGKEDFWVIDNPYEQFFSMQRINYTLYGTLHNSDIIDAAIIIQRNSDIIIECHTMKEDAFLRLLGTYNGYTSVQPASPTFLTTGENDGLSHLVLRQPIKGHYKNSIFSQTVANLYLTIPFNKLLGEPDDESIQCFCAAAGDTLHIFYKNGTGSEAIPSYFSLSELKENTQVFVNDVGYIAVLKPLNFKDLYLLCLTPGHLLKKQMQPVFLEGLISMLILLVVTITGNLSIKKFINRPVKNIVSDMQRICKGDYSYRLSQSEVKEMQDISTGVNNLLDELVERAAQITKTQKNLYELRLLHRESQILALQAQINPHFLYNTLECIRSIAQCYHIPEISKTLSAMIQIYRYSASNDHMGTVESEVLCGQNYAEIMNVRFEGRFRFYFTIDSSVLNTTPVPRMVIQPLLENAVNHGFENSMETGEIIVNCIKKDNDVILSVRDNGKGISAKQLEELCKRLDEDKPAENKEGNIGLYNVHQRLKRKFGDAYGLTIESIEGEFTEVLIRVPYNSISDNESDIITESGGMYL